MATHLTNALWVNLNALIGLVTNADTEIAALWLVVHNLLVQLIRSPRACLWWFFKLDNLTCFFNRNLDFYQYYRFHSTLYDEYYVVRGKFDLRLCTDSAQFDKDLNFSTLFLRVALTMATWE